MVCPTKLSLPPKEAMPSGILEKTVPRGYDGNPSDTKGDCGDTEMFYPDPSMRKHLFLQLSTGASRYQFLRGLSQPKRAANPRTHPSGALVSDDGTGGKRLAVLAPLRTALRGTCASGSVWGRRRLCWATEQDFSLCPILYPPQYATPEKV